MLQAPERILEAIRLLAGQTFFSVVFTKRMTGEKRRMTCRFGVRRDVTGRGQRYVPIERSLMTVFDVKKDDYRNVPLDAIQELRIRGQRFHA
jgi:hypothetical protein